MFLEEFIKEFIINYGMISVFILVFLEYASFPLPSEVVLPFMGIVGAINSISYFKILFVSVIAGILGSVITYFIGFHFGNKSIDYITIKFPKTRKSIFTSYKWLKKYDNISVLLSRVIPLARTFISIVAGAVRMKPFAFILYSSIGITIWNSMLIGLGFIFGNNSELIGLILKRYSIIVVILVIIAIGILVIKNKDKIKEKLF